MRSEHDYGVECYAVVAIPVPVANDFYLVLEEVSPQQEGYTTTLLSLITPKLYVK